MTRICPCPSTHPQRPSVIIPHGSTRGAVMCGICGATGDSGAIVLRNMTATLTHRGPDDAGFCEAPGIALGVRRLSIIDVPGGHQPIANEDGTVVLAFNGEIYNHCELRTRLEG